MSYLSGVEAFDRLVDRITELAAENARLEHRLASAEQAHRESDKARSAAVKINDHLHVKIEALRAKIQALHGPAPVPGVHLPPEFAEVGECLPADHPHLSH